MNRFKRIVLAILSVLPVPSLSFAAQEELAIDVPQLKQRGNRLADMYDAQYFSPEFYEQMKALGIKSGRDFSKIKDENARELIREAIKAEVIQLGLAGSPSPQ